MSWYITIRGSADYSVYVKSASLREFLSGYPGLQLSPPSGFVSETDKPWVSIVMAECDSSGNYAVENVCPRLINVVELICSDFEDPVWYDSLATEIAVFLKWSAHEDHEQRRIWPK